MGAEKIAALAGAFGLAMVLGAVFFQYVVGVAPCEVCYWQRYPHAAAGFFGLCGFLFVVLHPAGGKAAPYFAAVALILIASAGVLGVYHSGVEWKLWAGPDACTGERYVFRGAIDLNVAPTVRCDIAQRFLGISLANLNAIFSLGVAVLGAIMLRDKTLAARLWAAAAAKCKS